METDFYREIIEAVKNKKLEPENLNKIKRELSKKYKLGYIPTNIEILLRAKKTEREKLKALQLKPTRSISGVANVAIMSAPYACPPQAQCTFCPGGPNSQFGTVPKSYTGHEPSTMRGIRNDYDPYLQVFNRIQQYVLLGHSFDKIELIIMGGTFTSYSKVYQEKFIKYALKAMNDFSDLFFIEKRFNIEKFKEFFELPGDIEDHERAAKIKEKLLKIKGDSALDKEQQRNEKANIKCVGLTLESRSDYLKKDYANYILELGCTRVEIGIQSVYEKPLIMVKRGNTTQDNIEAIRDLKDLGFKINLHYMLGLPGIKDKKEDLEGMKQLFSNPDYKPDMLKIYPCMVFKGTPLYEEYVKGNYKPYSTEEAAKMIAAFKPFVGRYCRIMRVNRDIPSKMNEAGIDKTNLRQYVDQFNHHCKCIRCREVGHVYKKTGKKPEKIACIIEEYEASKGKEFFISYEDKEQDILLGFIRMRFPSRILRKEITKTSALIRELHVYGSAVMIGKKESLSITSIAQHKGLGKKLLKNAETIAKKQGKDKIVIIAALGTREYYRKLGYRKEGPYMIKKLRVSLSVE
ncbi:tRNA uridine(34) 5-carboxymethylaminomethyl modification radical SAM/GNAT enzyme Elp3 [Candidatus Woesearchaeota archaeon]|nr:tRNA uridine(34) 5-carboxymethylaminomethyl modification radical SAM/GNAT enzyme Elp3 [Candidatus Woesearchaeota archaeon]